MKQKFVRQWSHENSPLLWAELIAVGDSMQMKKSLAFDFGGHYFIGKSQTVIFYKNIATAARARKFGSKKYANPRFVAHFCRRVKVCESDLARFSSRLKRSSLRNKTNLQLLKIFQQFFEKNSTIYAYFRFARPDFYQDVVDKMRNRFKNLDDSEFATLLSGRMKRNIISLKDGKILAGLKAVGGARFSMHKTWERAYHQADTLFSEIGRRAGISSLELQNCISTEIKASLRGKKLDKKIIDNRLKSFKLFLSDGKTKVISPWLEDKTIEEGTQVKGMVAYGGQTKGCVSIIPESLAGTGKKLIAKMPVGNILVTVMTAPDMVPAMKKAAAIVTDEGGLLCHAAIVARELKKPCIVSTGKATKIFKDGDMVEVDTEKGIVRKI